MFQSACVVGAGRVGTAVHARLSERLPEARLTGRELACDRRRPGPPLRARPRHRRGRSLAAPGPWVAHTSGATRLGSLEPHRRRFALHPLQTFQRGLGPEQLDGAWGAVSAESDESREAGFALARLLGLEPFELDDEERPVYHAAATVAASVPLDPAACGGGPHGRGGGATGSARAPHAADDGQRLRAHRALRARRSRHREPPISARSERAGRSSSPCTARSPMPPSDWPCDEDRPDDRRAAGDAPASARPGHRSGSSPRWARSTTATWP